MRLKFLSLLPMLASLLTGCDEVVHPPCNGESPRCPGPNYASPTAPESLITNLQQSYRQRDIEHYTRLLAPEFMFKFQPIDASNLGYTYWTRAQDSTGTRALLTTAEVSDIRIDLGYANRDSSIDMSPPVDSLGIRIISTDLQVDQTDGTTWFVSDRQDFLFRKGRAGNGEDSNHWLIYEWDELPSLRSPGPTVNSTTWGKLKTKYGS